LTSAEIEELLATECYGHLGFTDEKDRICILPITYAYKDNYIYGISEMGGKIRSLRKHPQACLQVERLNPPSGWESVQVWGVFEEMHGKDLSNINTLIANFWDRFDEHETIFSPLRDIAVTDELPNVLFRISVDETAGKRGGHKPLG
ncbi:MAG: pyridoxamine 5'-phosphate oxidase family protein, partial [Candidatus Peregrinibacteria bacterium]|nr:pyridoxamine 5'-phosphate oxidase family protein [Candidatus Peregrinibacteria bacterium]